MEPDHCANIEELLLRFPDLKIVGNAKTLTFAKQFYDMDMEGKTITVKENDSIYLGSHTPVSYTHLFPSSSSSSTIS